MRKYIVIEEINIAMEEGRKKVQNRYGGVNG